jgi:hypothetical protein
MWLFEKQMFFLLYLIVLVSLGSRVCVFVREFWSLKAQSIWAPKTQADDTLEVHHTRDACGAAR